MTMSCVQASTCRLARRQLRKIRRLRGTPGWSIRRLDATAVLTLKTSEAKDPETERAAWEEDVAGPAARAVATFLGGNNGNREGHRDDDDDKAGLVAAVAKEVAMMAGAEWCGLQPEKLWCRRAVCSLEWKQPRWFEQ